MPREPKSPWYTTCRRQQESWRASTATLSSTAKGPGTTWVDGRGGRKEVGPFPICLPAKHADLNLLPGIRDEALRRFARHGIQWHGWTPGADGTYLPSTHLLDSQVQCINVLLALAKQERHLLDLVRQAEPDATDLVVVEDGSPVAFEWIGDRDYLGEGRGRPRHRGRFATSADALVVVERADGGRTGILVEWKFIESYDHPKPFFGDGGTDRREVYRPIYVGDATPFDVLPELDVFFQEPHYQILRQALLASEMVKAQEFGIDRAVLLHCVPSGNRTLRQTVPEGLVTYGVEIDEVWHRLLPGPRVRYACVDTTPLFTATPELAERYGALARSAT
jgi:hypothetical protein